MGNLFFLKLAVSNLRKNTKAYLPFILTCIGATAMFYMVCALSNNRGIREMSQSAAIMLGLTSRVSFVFAVIFLFYTNSFLMKQRKMELGLYNVLGMGKRHIALMIIWEILLIAATSLVLGLVAGIALNKLMYLTLVKLINGTITLGFDISVPAVASVLVLLVAIFGLILLDSLRQIYFSRPVELLKGGQVGEREPKAKWLIALLGLLSLGIGYYIAFIVKNPVDAINLFFIAVILVIIGTYLLFTAGSIAWLKLLRNNKRYYYKTKHFISLSGMMYRMKQNAAGLANICILSTAVLVMLSTTLSLYIGLEDVLQTRYPQSLTLDVHVKDKEQLHGIIDAVLKGKELNNKGDVSFDYFSFVALDDGDTFTIEADASLLANANNVRNLIFIPLVDYNAMAESQKALGEGEILLFSNRIEYGHNTLRVLGESFSVKEILSEIPCGDIEASDIAASYYVVVEDIEAIERIQKALAGLGKENWMHSPIWHRYAFDLDAAPEAIISAGELIQNRLDETGMAFKAECREIERRDYMGMYGGLFFIGVFLGILFIMAAVLIIYYKQITEGYIDKERFAIMKNVGLSSVEIKQSIRSQILVAFFLPLVMSGLHITAAFPSLTQILAILNLRNMPLFALCTVACYGAFTVFYTMIYNLTARVYYRIVG